MKRILIIVVLLFFSFYNYAQQNNPLVERRQISPRLNLSAVPHVEYIKVAGNMNLAGGISLLAEINNKFYLGGTFSKKLQKDFINYEPVAGDLNLSYQYAGLIVGGFINLGIYKTKVGRYVKRKTRITYSGSFNGGAFWTKNSTGEQVSGREYFYVAQPSVGAIREMTKFIFLEMGLRYPIAFRVNDNWESYNISNSDFTGPGVYLALKYSLFR
ncbi:MAG: hypothetical protein ABFS35_12860 [Bacteroidota bacterium]